MRKVNSNNKTCPLVNGKCLTTGCELYDEPCKRCTIGLLAYNVYVLTKEMKNQVETERQ